jgi:hypothetical protein
MNKKEIESRLLDKKYLLRCFRQTMNVAVDDELLTGVERNYIINLIDLDITKDSEK